MVWLQEADNIREQLGREQRLLPTEHERRGLRAVRRRRRGGGGECFVRVHLPSPVHQRERMLEANMLPASVICRGRKEAAKEVRHGLRVAVCESDCCVYATCAYVKGKEGGYDTISNCCTSECSGCR